MTQMYTSLPKIICERINTTIPMDDDGVLPYYDGASILNLPAAICQWLEIPIFGAAPLAPAWMSALSGEYDRVIVLLVDGLGYNLLNGIIIGDGYDIPGLDIWGQIAETSPPLPLTSVCPSTTAAALTSFWTAAPPLLHGMVAYEVWLKEYGILANMISFSPASARSDVGGLKRSGFNPDQFMPLPTFGAHLRANDVQFTVMQHTSIARTDLSQMLTLPGEVLSFRSTSDLWITLAEQLQQKSRQKQFTYIYWGVLDELMHFFGPQDERVLLELASFSQQMRGILERIDRSREKTLLLLTADHGQIHTPRIPDFDLRCHPTVLDCLSMPPSGESRLPILYVHPRKEERLHKYIQETWHGLFTMLPSEQLADSGLLGFVPTDHPHRHRLGDWVVFPRGNAYWWWANKENNMLGRHGGLSPDEMLVPLLPILK